MRALYDYVGEEGDELSFKAGDTFKCDVMLFSMLQRQRQGFYTKLQLLYQDKSEWEDRYTSHSSEMMTDCCADY